MVELWFSALAGAALLVSALVCYGFRKQTAAPLFFLLAIIFGTLAALCFFYCAAGLMLAIAVD